MGLKVGSLYVSVASDIAKISKDFDYLNKKIDTFGKVVKKSLQFVGIGIGIRELYSIGQQTVDTMYKIKKLADGTGMATENFAAFAHIADRLDLQIRHLEIGFRKLSTQISLAKIKGGESEKIFKDLNVEYQNIDGTLRPLAEVLFDIADRFKETESGALKAYYATKLFATSSGASGGGLEIVTMLNRGRKELETWVAKAKELGITFNDDVGQSIEKLKMSFKDLKAVGIGATRELMAGMSEGLTRIAKSWEDFLKIGDVRSTIGEILGEIAKITSGISMMIAGTIKLGVVAFIAGIKTIAKTWNDFVEKANLSKFGEFLRSMFNLKFLKVPITIEPDYDGAKEVNEQFKKITEAIDKLMEPIKIDIDIKQKKPLIIPSKKLEEFKKKLDDYIASLRTEAYILTLTNEQQTVYNHLKRAGFDLDEKTGAIKQKNFQRQADLILKIGEENRALLNVKDSLSELIPEEHKINQLFTDTIAVLKSGKITMDEYIQSVDNLAKQYNIIAKRREMGNINLDIAKMESDIAENMYSQVTIAQRRLEMLQKEYELRLRYMATMKQETEMQIELYTQELEIQEKLKQQMIEQENIIKENTSAIYGMKSALQKYTDELANIGQQSGDLIINVFRKLEDQLIEFIKTSKVSVKDMVDYIITELMRIALRQAIIKPLAGALGGLFSPGPGLSPSPGVAPSPSPVQMAHKGGTVGEHGIIPPTYYDHIPRYHKGLKPKERLTVLEIDEEVIPKEKAGKGNVSIVVPVNMADRNPLMASDLRTEIEEATERVVRRYM